MDTLEKIKNTADFLRSRGFKDPEAGIVLGTGLGGLTSEIENEIGIDYSEIPGFPVSTVRSHAGKLLYGDFGGRKIVAMSGRFHYYEGYGADQIAFPVRVMIELGIKALFLSNASGGTNPSFSIGDIMIVTDHINLLPNPLMGPNDDRIGPRFPDMSEPYDKKLIARADEIARNLGIPVQHGIYLSTTGPTFETPAEYRHFRIIGADAVGMSTTPEVIVARHRHIPCFAFSIITDLGVDGKIEYITEEFVQQAASSSEVQMRKIMKELIATF
jgi:purine-nucleoside phosphorylase